MENEIVAKENGFIYKGEFYGAGDLSIETDYSLVDVNTKEEINACIYNMKKTSEESLYKIKKKYKVQRGFSFIEIFDTEEEAKHFIELVTANIK